MNGAPEMAIVQVLPNSGRCDYKCAYYITTIIDHNVKKGEEKDSIVLFLKDASVLHQPGAWNDFESVIRVASSSNGFECGIIPGFEGFE